MLWVSLVAYGLLNILYVIAPQQIKDLSFIEVQQIAEALIASAFYYSVDYKRIKLKLIAFIICFYTVIIAITDNLFSYIPNWFYWLEVGVFILGTLWTLRKTSTIQSLQTPR